MKPTVDEVLAQLPVDVLRWLSDQGVDESAQRDFIRHVLGVAEDAYYERGYSDGESSLLADVVSLVDDLGLDVDTESPLSSVRRLLEELIERRSHRSCSNCERCTWNPGPDCGRADHAHCLICGHCSGRHNMGSSPPKKV